MRDLGRAERLAAASEAAIAASSAEGPSATALELAVTQATISLIRRDLIAAERIVLAGFSQGGAMALHVALRHPAALAGVLALSTYLVLEETLEAEVSEAGRTRTAFLAHGQYDPMVPMARPL